MDTTTIVVIAIAVLVVLALAGWFIRQRQHTQELREKFGSEYDYVVDQEGDRRKAEAELEEREKRVEALDIQSLATEEQDRFLEEWKKTQAEFVDWPSEAVARANQLIKEVMNLRGFPVADFERRAADISVLYPDVVTNYRAAHALAEKNEHEDASTEELRQAMVFYRSLFEELLETETTEPKEKAK